jgi:hypothetical protein
MDAVAACEHRVFTPGAERRLVTSGHLAFLPLEPQVSGQLSTANAQHDAHEWRLSSHPVKPHHEPTRRCRMQCGPAGLSPAAARPASAVRRRRRKTRRRRHSSHMNRERIGAGPAQRAGIRRISASWEPRCAVAAV